MSANSRKRIILLNESQSLCILALSCQLQISLDSDMSRAGRLTRCSTCLMGLDTVVISVIPIPVRLAPGLVCRKKMLGVLDLSAVFFAKLLSQRNSSCGAHFNAASAGYALFFLNVRAVSGSRHIGCIEKL